MSSQPVGSSSSNPFMSLKLVSEKQSTIHNDLRAFHRIQPLEIEIGPLVKTEKTTTTHYDAFTQTTTNALDPSDEGYACSMSLSKIKK